MKRKVVICVSLIVVLILIGSLVFVISSRGKKVEETTNRSEDTLIDRGDEETVAEDTITYKDMTVAFALPEGFYSEFEGSDNDFGYLKEYMDHNFNTMVDVYIYEPHTQDIGLIDMEHPENSVVYKDMYIDADEWFRELRLTYLEREDDADIKKETVNGNEVTYFTRYVKNDSGIMQGGVMGFIRLDNDYYYCVKVVEFDMDSEPTLEKYKDLFTIK